jgi:hypothetical protein
MIAEISASPAPEWLTSAAEPLGPLPLADLLRDSVYYPACGFDGDPIKFLARNFHSFVYADYGQDRAELIRRLGELRGYRLLALRDVDRQEIIPRELMPRNGYPRRVAWWVRPWFATWAIFECLEGFDRDHGPKRFSLPYIRGEGVLRYLALYHHKCAAPAVVALIQPGHRFGGNWTNFESRGDALAYAMLESRLSAVWRMGPRRVSCPALLARVRRLRACASRRRKAADMAVGGCLPRGRRGFSGRGNGAA